MSFFFRISKIFYIVICISIIASEKLDICCGLDLKCPPKAYVLKFWSTVQWCLEMGSLGGDWMVRAMRSSVH
jgi:hypothetical protein